MELEELFSLTERRISSYRRIDRFIKTHEFINYFDAHREHHDLILFLVAAHKIEELRHLTKGHTPLECMSHSQLRKEAQKLGIKCYSRMNKEELLRSLCGVFT